MLDMFIVLGIVHIHSISWVENSLLYTLSNTVVIHRCLIITAKGRLGAEVRRKWPPGRPKSRLEYKIKMNLREIVWSGKNVKLSLCLTN
jgi:hypothetical protein